MDRYSIKIFRNAKLEKEVDDAYINTYAVNIIVGISDNGKWVKYSDVEDIIEQNKELVVENEKLKEQLKTKGLTINLSIDDIDCLKQYLDYLKGEIEVALNHQVQGIKIKLMNYDEFKQKTR